MSFATTTDSAGHGRTKTRSTGIESLVDRLGRDPVTLLAVWAHPDDESYLGGGLMAEVARRGGRVISVTATLGEHGTADPDRDPPHELAVRREAELGTALAALGAGEQHLLGFPDGGCDFVDDEIGARHVGRLLDEIRPDVVVGFGPDGVTGHPDHRAVGRWTRRAVADVGDTVPLLTTAAGAAWPADLLERMHSIEAFWPGYPERTLDRPAWPVALDGDRLEQKLAALACHESQIGPLHDVLGADDYRRLATAEAYCAANHAAEQALFDQHHRQAA